MTQIVAVGVLLFIQILRIRDGNCYGATELFKLVPAAIGRPATACVFNVVIEESDEQFQGVQINFAI